MNRKTWSTLLLVGLWILGAGCQASVSQITESPAPTRAGTLNPYTTATATFTPTLSQVTPPTSTSLPTTTPTPRTYTVKAGEDMSGIALRFRVALDALKTANPTVNPRLMKIGTVLIIPGTAPAPVSTQTLAPTATTQPVSLQPARCSPDPSGGAWCVVLASQSSAAPVFNLSVSLRLIDETGKQVAQQNGTLGMDLLPPATSLPVIVYFPGPLPTKFQVEAQVLSALPAQLAADRYPPVRVEGLDTKIQPDGLSAEASGQVVFADTQSSASQLRLLLVAFDSSNQVVGVRRWDGSRPPTGGQPAAFTIPVYSLGARIARVQVFAEAVK